MSCLVENLINEMLWLAQLRAGERSVDIKPVNLHEIFAQFAETVRAQLSGRPITFESEIGAGVRIIRTDPWKLHQIIALPVMR